MPITCDMPINAAMQHTAAGAFKCKANDWRGHCLSGKCAFDTYEIIVNAGTNASQ